jgi:hypothetical protein
MSCVFHMCIAKKKGEEMVKVVAPNFPRLKGCSLESWTQNGKVFETYSYAIDAKTPVTACTPRTLVRPYVVIDCNDC